MKGRRFKNVVLKKLFCPARIMKTTVYENKQSKASLIKILRHLDILEDGDEVVEQEVSFGQEDLGKLRKFLLVDQKIVGDVENILKKMQQL